MDLVELRSQIGAFVDASRRDSERFEREMQERAAMVDTYSGITSEKLLAMEKDGLYEYLAPLWAMRIWGNKQYVIDKLVDDNGLDALRTQLAALDNASRPSCPAPVPRTRVMRQPRVPLGRAVEIVPGEGEHGG